MTAKKIVKKIKSLPVNAKPKSAPVTPESVAADEFSQDTYSKDNVFPIVGLGASAGGLNAFEEFFSGMPANVELEMAFVLVQHLAPDHKSILTELISRYTTMQVFEISDGMVVQVNCAYIIPPNYDLAYLKGRLHLLEPSAPRGQRLPIDFFFRSLAQDQGEHAIGIILSGTGSDGTLGVRAIKGEGGMVMVQELTSTEFDGMPRSAIATGLVDFELPPAAMPAKLLAYAKHAYGKLPRHHMAAPSDANSLSKKIFILLRAQTGHDFSQYKPSTINRRIERRMAVHQVDSIDNYVKYLQQTPAEIEALFRDLLIGVTKFFRDVEAFQALEEQIIPALFKDKPAGSVIRIWTTGCSTGEEAYSIAILLHEHIELIKKNFNVQLFATDIDSRAIATARIGLYPASIADDITAQRLSRFFSVEADGSAYRIHKNIRDMLVFSEQDVIKDPPFSKLDMISCRNLLIYMDTELQKKLIPLFHFALKPSGILFLGTSEGIGDFSTLFNVLDRKVKFYQRKEQYGGTTRNGLGRVLPPLFDTGLLPLTNNVKPQSNAVSPKISLKGLTEQTLLQKIAPATALVNERGDILYLHGRTGMYLEMSAGEVGINNILKMSREGLRRDLTSTLLAAVKTKTTVRCAGINVRTNAHFTKVNLTVCPALADANASLDFKGAALSTGLSTGTNATANNKNAKLDVNLYLIILEEALSPVIEGEHGDNLAAKLQEKLVDADAEARIDALRQELRAKDEYLQSTHEELESSNEELKSSNEEMQSVNEELQSTNEELETSKEELQSVNEELATVNNELQTKVVDLSRANNDMNNLLAGTGIGTVFVDHQLRILRFTPAVSAIINLILSDIGRPVAHIVSNLVGYDNMVADTQSVLNTLILKEVEVQTKEGSWYAMRIQPYRTLNNVIEGAVISFVNISEMIQARIALDKANDLLRLAVVVRDAHDAITVQSMTGQTLAWNPGAVRMYGWTEAEALKINVRDRIPQDLREKALAKLKQLSQAEILEPYLTQRTNKQGVILKVSIISTALINESGDVYAIATTERLVSEKAV
ncbi:MAG: PAS domain-containing protein [Bdellovibrio sp.]|nr:PAS domain-containing protein [Methylotenera sp.]